MSTARHILFREPTQDDWNTFAAEFWDHWDEGEPRGHWAARAADVFCARFPQAGIPKATAERWFCNYWDRHDTNGTTELTQKQTYALFFREYERWWDAFVAEAEDEGLTHEEAVFRFTVHFHKIFAKRLGVPVDDTEAQKNSINIIVDCNNRFDLGFELVA
jgi:hypothetical protein